MPFVILNVIKRNIVLITKNIQDLRFRWNRSKPGTLLRDFERQYALFSSRDIYMDPLCLLRDGDSGTSLNFTAYCDQQPFRYVVQMFYQQKVIYRILMIKVDGPKCKNNCNHNPKHETHLLIVTFCRFSLSNS